MRRWAAADEDAERVLAHEGSLLAVTPWTRWSVALGVGALVVVGVGSVALPRSEADGTRVAVAAAVAALAVVAFVVGAVRSARVRRPIRTAFPTVTTALSGRERHAVARAVDGRIAAPDDRLRIVRATAVLRAAADRVEQALWLAVLVTTMVLGASAERSPILWLGAVLAVVALGIALVTWFDVARVRRALQTTPWESAARR